MAIVTISRGTYTGGMAVADGVAAVLGHPCVSREVVVDAAHDSGFSQEELQSTLQDPPQFWEKTPGRVPAHLNLVRTALLRRAQGGDLVYHGYAGHLLLGSISHVVRVRVIADRESRVKAAMADKDMSREAAEAFVKKLDTQLMKWTRFLYGVEWEDASLYDLVLNLQRLQETDAVDTIVRTTRLPAFQPTAASRKAFDDLLLSSEVWAALSKDPRTRAVNVRVAADGGEVFVTGLANNERALTAVRDVAARVEGVVHVRSEVGVGRTWQW